MFAVALVTDCSCNVVNNFECAIFSYNAEIQRIICMCRFEFLFLHKRRVNQQQRNWLNNDLKN